MPGMRLQPRGPARLDLANPITRGLVLVQVGGQDGDLANVNGLPTVATAAGMAKRFTSASQQRLVSTNIDLKSAPLTFFSLFNRTPSTQASDRILLSIGNSGTDSSRHILYIASGGTRASMFSGGATTAQATSSTMGSGFNAIAGRVISANSRDVWINGIRSASNTTSVTTGTCDTLMIGANINAGSISGHLSGETAINLAWNRALSDDEMRSISANPWQIFAAQDDDLEEFDGASASTGTTLTLKPTPGALAVTGIAPSITRTTTLTIQPAAGALGVTGYAPNLRQVLTTRLSPAAGALAIAGGTPTIQQSSAAAFRPAPGALGVQGYAPSLVQTSTRTLSPAPAAMAITGYAPTVTRTGTPLDPRYARPEATVSAGSWYASSGTNLAAMLDEATADSSDYIEATTPSTARIALAPVADPGTSTGHVVRYMIDGEPGSGLKVRLMQGATVIAEWTHAEPPATPTLFAQVLTAQQCDSITDYASLAFEFEAT